MLASLVCVCDTRLTGVYKDEARRFLAASSGCGIHHCKDLSARCALEDNILKSVGLRLDDGQAVPGPTECFPHLGVQGCLVV